MMDHPLILLGAFTLGGYLVGSTPFGVLVARLHGVDLRAQGSGNVGATNVGRVLGRKWGYLCFFLDLLKGLLPVLLAGWVIRDGALPGPAGQGVWLGAGLGCILGHVFSFYLRFKGGKGVATSLGVVLGIWPYFTFAGLTAFALWAVVVLAWRYVSLASLVAAFSFVPLVILYNLSIWPRLWPLLIFASLMVLLIVLRHRSNVKRLLAGTENRIGQGRKATS
jgi:glycerol-3-phosphate acyltransferase PlsY